VKLLRLLPVVIAAGVIGPPSADAAVSCSYADGLPLGSGNNSATVTLSAGGDEAVIGTAGDPAELRVNGSPCALTPIGGTRARLDNLDTIRISDTSAAGDTAVEVAEPARFVPGEGSEGDTTPEIEWEVDLGAGRDVLVGLSGDASGDRVRLGAGDGPSRADFNPGNEATHQDPDWELSGVEAVFLAGGVGADQMTGAGGPGFSGALPEAVALFGQDGPDALVGGDGADWIVAGAADDVTAGGDGADVIDGGDGDEDYVNLVGEPRAEVDLADGTVMAPGGNDSLANIEGVIGTAGDDSFAGDGTALNVFDGSRGDDSFRGRGGRDVVLGSNGDDTASGGGGADVLAGEKGRDLLRGGRGRDIIDSKRGGSDVANCGDGRDGYLADRSDEVSGCEIELTEAGKGAYKVAGTGRLYEGLGFARGPAADHLPLRLRR
jgi:Ca2+-binding RTX toxin-like protein